MLDPAGKAFLSCHSNRGENGRARPRPGALERRGCGASSRPGPSHLGAAWNVSVCAPGAGAGAARAVRPGGPRRGHGAEQLPGPCVETAWRGSLSAVCWRATDRLVTETGCGPSGKAACQHRRPGSVQGSRGRGLAQGCKGAAGCEALRGKGWRAGLGLARGGTSDALRGACTSRARLRAPARTGCARAHRSDARRLQTDRRTSRGAMRTAAPSCAALADGLNRSGARAPAGERRRAHPRQTAQGRSAIAARSGHRPDGRGPRPSPPPPPHRASARSG